MKGLNVSGGWELPCCDGHKSFYGKAQVKFSSGNEKVLLSYGTPVCGISHDGSFHRYWPGYSATTMRHVNSFLALFGLAGGGKPWWDALPIEDAPSV